MGNLYITEYVRMGRDVDGKAIPVGEEPGTDQPVVVYTTHIESAAFSSKTVLVRVHTDAICSILFGTAPVATTGNKRLAANQTEYFSVIPGSGLKLSAVTNT